MVIYYFHDREVGFTRRFSILRLPRCREVGYIQRLYIISMVVRSGLLDGLVFWVFPRCREVGFIQRSYIISTTVRSCFLDGLVY